MYVKKPCYLGQTTDTYQLSPPCTEVNKAVADIVSSIRWLEVFIIHDEKLGKTKSKDVYIYHMENSRFIAYQISSGAWVTQ